MVYKFTSFGKFLVISTITSAAIGFLLIFSSVSILISNKIPTDPDILSFGFNLYLMGCFFIFISILLGMIHASSYNIYEWVNEK